MFERCWEAGGLQLRLLPFALIALLVYSVGYPVTVFYFLHKNRELIMEDQLLRAKGMGDTRLENTHAYEVRKKFHKLYYHFRPDKWYWIMCVLARKFGIAFTALMFNKNPAFQLSMALLVMFISYAAQVKHTPYMSMSERDEVLRAHKAAAESGNQVHQRLAVKLAEVERLSKKKARRFSWSGAGMSASRYEAGTVFCFNYNTVESVLLFCAVLVNLAGVMFESNRFETDYFQLQKDIITIIVLLIIFASIAYFAVVLVTEVYLMVKEANEKKAAKLGRPRGKSGAKSGRARASTRRRVVDVDDVVVEDSAVNPMFAKSGGAEMAMVGTADMASSELFNRNKKLMEEVQKLKKAQQQQSAAAPIASSSAAAAAAAAVRPGRSMRKTEFSQVATRAGRRARLPKNRRGRSEDRDAAAPSTPAPASSDGDTSGALSPRSETLPNGWKAAKDKKSGRTYYVNRLTRQTTWKRPKAAASAASPAAAPAASDGAGAGSQD